MWRKLALRGSRRCRFNDVAEGPLCRNAAESASAPATQVVLNSPVQGFAKNHPRLPHGARHDAYPIELDVCRLWPVTAPHRHHEANNLTSTLESCPRKRAGNEVGEQGVAGDHDVRTRDQNPDKAAPPFKEKAFKRLVISRGQHSEPGKRCPSRSIETGRNPPDATLALTQLALLLVGVLDQSIRRIGNDRMD